MAVFKCKMCGGALDIQEGSLVAVCSFCGTKQTVPKLDNETRINLYDRANHFRRNNDYDKAMSIYEQLLEADKTDAEAYWSILLCKYGVEYVEDPKTHKMMPTINRAQYTSIFADEDYKSAIQYADGYQREVYENEAKELDKIQKGILAISQKEDPFDIFICYKETDAYGRRTQDSVLAQDLYYQLTKEGFKVFFSRITLEDKLGTAYEPYIFAALNTAKIMVVIGTSKENLNSVWVKNEWSRFLALTKKDNSKVLIPAYRDMDPYDLPEEFSHLQAQDMSKLGFMQDLIRGIKKILAKDEKVVVVSQNGLPSQSANVEALLKRAYIACEDGDFAKADNFAEQILNINPELAEAYVIKLLAECKVRKLDDLKLFGENINVKTNFKRAFRYAKADTKAQLETIGKENYDHVQKYPIYCKAQGLIKQEQYNAAIDCLSKIADYKDSNELIDILKQKIVEQKKARIYTNAVSSGFCVGQSENLIKKSIEALKSLGDYKDCEEQIQKLYKRLDDLRYQKQIEAEEAKQCAIKRKHNRKVCFIMSSISAVVLTIVLLITFLAIIPLSEIKKADNMVLSGDLEEALSVYSELNGFGDSEIRIAKINAVLNAREHFAEKNTNEGINDIFAQDGTIQVTYVCNGGSIIKSQNNDTITRQLLKGYALAVPTKAGYSFEKWELSEYCVGFDLQNITAELRLEAVWSECAYSISYDLDGGTVATTNPTSYKYESEDIVIQNPTKTGYTFIGWSGEDIEEPTTELIIRQGSQGDRSFIANWQANIYKITFNVNGGTIEETQLQVKYDTYVSLPTPKKSGSTFSGWYCEGNKIDSGEWSLTKDCTLDAQWDLITYTISYNLNGGTNASENPSSYTAYDEFSLQEPTKTGYTFLGWSGNNVSETTKKVTIPKGSIGNRSYTAVWQANSYTINYDADGGTINETVQNVTFDESVTLYSAKKTGYTFAGWYYGDTKLSSGIWKITNNVSVKAKWVANSNTKYMVYHYLENANDSEYTLTKTQTLYGTTATSVSPSVESYAYFIAPTKQTITIAGDGSSFLKYYYKREKFTLTLYPNNGDSVQTKTFKYGQSIADKTTWYNKTDFSFGGWFTDEMLTTEYTNTTMGSSSVTLYAYWSGETKPSLLSYTKATSSFTITGCSNSVSSIVIPTHIANIPVKSIKNLSSSILQYVILPNGVATIEDNAFSNVKSLRTINLNNVETIGNNAFSGCSALQSPTFEQLKSLGEYAFKDCSAITNTVLPDTLTGNLNYCFYNCNALENISISKNIEMIATGSFYGCSSLEEIEIPFIGPRAGVTNNDRYQYPFGGIFGYTSYANSVSVKQSFHEQSLTNTVSVTYYLPSSLHSVKVNGEYITDGAFSNCSMLTSVVLNSGVKYIGEAAFSGCTSIEHIYIPDTCNQIQKLAFNNCSKLMSITIPNSVLSMGEAVFSGCSSLESLSIPFVGASKEIVSNYEYKNMLGYSFGTTPYDTSIKVEQKYKDNYESYSYYLPTKLKSVTVTGGIIGDGAFSGCSNISEIILPDGIKQIGYYAFYNCSSITKLVLPNTIDTIHERAFEGCTNLTSIEVPESVTHISKYAFSRCASLSSITLPFIGESINGSQNKTFGFIFGTQVPTGLKTVVIKNGSIADYAFYNCETINSIILPEDATTIGTMAFSGCKNLASISIPDSVVTIGDYAFDGCTNLADVYIGNGVSSIHQSAFWNCAGLSTINVKQGNTKYHSSGNCIIDTETKTLLMGCNDSIIPNDGSVTIVGTYAFRDCSGIESISIPNTIERVEDYAFYNCSKLFTIIIPNSVKIIGNSVFFGCSNLNALSIPFVGAKADITSNDTNQYPFGYIFGTNNYDGGVETEQLYHGDSTTTTTSTKYYIPATLSTVTITGGEVLYGAFYNCGTINEVVISDTVKNIGDSAFYKCNGLKSVSIGKGVVNMGSSAFFECAELTTVNLVNGLQSLGGECVFGYCKKLTTIELPDTLEEIGATTFIYSGLTEINIPNAVTKIGYNAFYGCTGLAKVDIDNLNDWYNIMFVNIYSNPMYFASTLRVKGEQISGDIVVDGVSTIPAYTYKNATRITSLFISESVTEIGEGILSGCSSLNSVTIPFIGAKAGVTNGDKNQYPFGYIFGTQSYDGSIGTEQKYYGESSITTTRYYIPSSLTSANVTGGNNLYGAFYNCNELSSITIGDNATRIEDYAFYGCSKLERFSVPDTVLYIGTSAFDNCIELKEISFEDNSQLATISQLAFHNCKKLSEIRIPNRVTNICDKALSGCSGLQKLTIPFVGATAEKTTNNNWMYLFGYIFGGEKYDGADYTEQNYYNSYTETGSCINYYIPTSLTVVVVTNGDIPDYAFNGCRNITRVELPQNATRIGEMAFARCKQLTDIIIPSSVTTICRYAFSGCGNITSFEIPQGVTAIEERAFSNCEKLTDINIPTSVTSIKGFAFSGCPLLTIRYKGTTIPASWDTNWNYDNNPVEFI